MPTINGTDLTCNGTDSKLHGTDAFKWRRAGKRKGAEHPLCGQGALGVSAASVV